MDENTTEINKAHGPEETLMLLLGVATFCIGILLSKKKLPAPIVCIPVMKALVSRAEEQPEAIHEHLWLS